MRYFPKNNLPVFCLDTCLDSNCWTKISIYFAWFTAGKNVGSQFFGFRLIGSKMCSVGGRLYPDSGGYNRTCFV